MTPLPTAQETHDQPLSLQMAQEAYHQAIQHPEARQVLEKIAKVIQETQQNGGVTASIKECHPDTYDAMSYWFFGGTGSWHASTRGTVVAVLLKHGYNIRKDSYHDQIEVDWSNPKPVH